MKIKAHTTILSGSGKDIKTTKIFYREYRSFSDLPRICQTMDIKKEYDIYWSKKYRRIND